MNALSQIFERKADEARDCESDRLQPCCWLCRRCIPNLRQPEPGLNRLPEGFRGTTSPDNSAKVEIDEFYKDPRLTCLIHQALSPIGNRELKIMNEEVQIARDEILGRSGAYLPFVTLGGSTGLERTSRFTENGAGIIDDPYLPGQHFTNPYGNYLGGVNLNWQIDIYRQLRNARDAAAAALRRRQ